MALWRQQLKTPDEQQCASRLLDDWDENDRWPQCIQPMYFGDECSKEDRQVMQHLDKVQNIFASTSMLYIIEAAHIPYTDNHEDTNTASINSSFFLHAGERNTQDLAPIEQDGEPSGHTDSQAGSEGYDSPTQSKDNNSHSEREPYFNQEDNEDNEMKSTSSTPPPDYEDTESKWERQS
jgi:hypothetical protein